MSIAMPVMEQPFRTQVDPADPAQASALGGVGGGNQSADESPLQTTVTKEGRLRIDNLPPADRQFSVAMHVASFGFFVVGPFAFVAPLVLWLIRKDQSTFADDHGREVVNVLITGVIVFLANLAATVPSLGFIWLAGATWYIIIAINMIRGAAAAGNGEYFRYPMTLRLLS